MNFKNYSEFVNESKSKGEYSYKEMRDFLSKIIKHFAPFKERFNGPYISVPADRNASRQVYELEKNLLDVFDDFYKKYKKENPSFNIWNFQFSGDPSLAKKVKSLGFYNYDLKSLFQVAASNPGMLSKVQVKFTSKKQDDFADAMHRGDYGPLD